MPSLRYNHGLMFLLAVAFGAPIAAVGQTSEDSLGTTSGETGTVIGGYGSALYQRDSNQKRASLDLERVVLFVGHSFGTISFFSELEMEDAKVSGNDGGEIAFEQAYLKFNLDQDHYITAGLFLPRIGITNETHLPTDLNGNERPQVETVIIPATWRELGIGFYGTINSVALQYSLGIVNGLNSATFEHGSGIREGRFEGRNASANNLAATGSLRFYRDEFRVQASGYYGGSVGLAPGQADSLELRSGLFGTPVVIGEADMQYTADGFGAKILGTVVSIPNAFEINRAYANNTPQLEYGAYVEIGYDFLHGLEKGEGKQLIGFVRYEKLDMNATLPSNGTKDNALNQEHIIVGAGYFPMRNVVIKGDVRFLRTGGLDSSLDLNRSSTDNTFVNLGLGFSF